MAFIIFIENERAKAVVSIYFVKSNLSLYSLYYAEACNGFAGLFSASLRLGNTATFKEMSQRWRAVGNIVSDLNGPRFEYQTSHSRDKRVAARPAGRYQNIFIFVEYYKHLIS